MTWNSAYTFGAVLLFAIANACSHETALIGRAGQINGPQANVERLKPAVEKADAVYTNPKFWELVEKRDWIASATPTEVITGRAVADALRKIRPVEQRYQFKLFGAGHLPCFRGATNASTSACEIHEEGCGVITVNVKDEDELSSLVNTVAHENTHVIGNHLDDKTLCHCGQDNKVEFTDTPDHPIEAEVWMVSYSLGDLAECFSLHDGEPAKTWDCFYERINHENHDRKSVECATTAGGIPTDILEKLQAKTLHCGPPAPPMERHP